MDALEKQWTSSRRIIESLKLKADRRRTLTQKLADWVTGVFGSFTFFALNVSWFASWIVVNTGMIPGVKPFDPFPFSLLTMVVSLEAIALAIFVLMSQNRQTQIVDLREETDLQVDVITEQEITKILQLLTKMLEKQGVDVNKDKVLQQMIEPTDTDKIEQVLEKQVKNVL